MRHATCAPRENFLSTSRLSGFVSRGSASLPESGWRRWKEVGGGARNGLDEEEVEEGERGTRCPKGVFRNRGKMEENRYSLVAGKSRVERAERGRKGV